MNPIWLSRLNHFYSPLYKHNISISTTTPLEQHLYSGLWEVVVIILIGLIVSFFDFLKLFSSCIILTILSTDSFMVSALLVSVHFVALPVVEEAYMLVVLVVVVLAVLNLVDWIILNINMVLSFLSCDQTVFNIMGLILMRMDMVVIQVGIPTWFHHEYIQLLFKVAMAGCRISYEILD